MERVRIGFVGCGRAGNDHVENLLSLEGVELKAVCDIGRQAANAAEPKTVEGGPAGADALHPRPARFRADVRRDGARPGIQRDAVGVARAGDAGGDEVRQARRHRGAGGDDAGRLLETGRDGGEDRVALRDDGELQLRSLRADDTQPGAERLLGEILHGEADTCTTCAGSSSPGRAKARGAGRGPRSQCQPVSDSRARPIANCMDINRGDRFETGGVVQLPIPRTAGVAADLPRG